VRTESRVRLHGSLSSPISDVVFESKGKHIYIYLGEKECTIVLLKPFFSKTHTQDRANGLSFGVVL